MRRLVLPTLVLSLAGLAAPRAGAQVAVPPGFTAELFAEGPEVSYVTGLAFDSQGVLHVTEADLLANAGRVLRVEDRDGDGRAETFTEVAGGLGLATGLAFRGNGLPRRPPEPGPARGGAPPTDLERIRRGEFRGQRLDLYVSHFTPGVGGTITLLRDRDGDGVADFRRDVVTGLPSDGLNGNQQPAIGPDGRIYFGQGARTNSGVPGGGPADGPRNGAILRADADGGHLEVFARGLRNAYDLAFTPEGELFATENGPDPSGPAPVVGAPDELDQIVAGEDYGWPRFFGSPPEGSGTVAPAVLFSPSTATSGLALMTSPTFCPGRGDLFAAQFGSFSDPSIGRRVVRIHFAGRSAAKVEGFASGFGRPLDVAVGPEGDLYVADFSNVFFSPRSAAIWRIRPVDSDGDGTPDACER